MLRFIVVLEVARIVKLILINGDSLIFDLLSDSLNQLLLYRGAFNDCFLLFYCFFFPI